MSCVHYKFSSKLTYGTITFDGLHISLCDLKKQIMGREKLKAAYSDLQITNAQTEEEYTDVNALIPKNSSVIVRRIPTGGIKSTSKTYVISRSEPVMGTTKAIDDPSASLSLAQLTKTVNLAEANASEEDKIKAMMLQSGHEYNPVNYMKKTLVGLPPPSYTCFRCGQPGHYIKNCPTNGDKNFETRPRIKKSTGIPTSFMMEVKDPNMKGAMLTNTGKYAIPIINAEAYAIGKKEKPPFLPEEASASSEEGDPIPEELLCLICRDLPTDAVVIPCCGNSYCDECIRTALLESDEHTCPTCHENEVSPDALVANKSLRQAVNNFKNKAGYTKRLGKQLPPPPPTTRTPTATPTSTPRPLIQGNLQPLMRSPTSRQQDPLKISVTSSPAHPTPSISSLTSNPSSLAPSVPGNPSSAPAPVPGRGKSCKYRSRSRSHGYHQSRSRSPPYRRYHSRWRSPQAFRGQSPTKHNIPQGETEREYFNRYRKVPPPYDTKAYYGQSVDFRDPFEKERYQEWERQYRQWYEKYYKGYTVGVQPRPSANREDIWRQWWKLQGDFGVLKK